jgi:hypothetical protein
MHAGTPPEPGAFHGCPYRHQPDNQLAALLGSLKLGGAEVSTLLPYLTGCHVISSFIAYIHTAYAFGCRTVFRVQVVRDVVMLAKSGNYQLACQKHFDITHPGHSAMAEVQGSDGVANHPNQWFQASVRYHKVGPATPQEARASLAWWCACLMCAFRCAWSVQVKSGNTATAPSTAPAGAAAPADATATASAMAPTFVAPAAAAEPSAAAAPAQTVPMAVDADPSAA